MDLIRLRPSLNIVNTLVYVYSSVPIRYNSGTGMDFSTRGFFLLRVYLGFLVYGSVPTR